MNKAFEKSARVLGSFGFASVILLFLALLTWLGTLEQVDDGILKVQQKYFDRLHVFHEVGDIVVGGRNLGGMVIPLPGVLLLLILLSINLLIGGIVRLRKRWDRSGIFITHLGICFLIAAAATKFWNSEDGQLTLYAQESGSEFQSSNQWEIALWKADARAQEALEHIIDGDDFTGLDAGETRVFQGDAVPFEFTVESYHENCRVMAAGESTTGRVVDGFYLDEIRWYREEEEIRNVAGCIVKVRSKESGAEEVAILYGLSRYPWMVEFDGESWQVELRPKTWDLPFTLVLDRFDRVLHPGTGMAKEFSSYVTKVENGAEKKSHITMNEPLRTSGYTLYQSGWGPQDARPGEPLYSTFSVVRNPADQWPKWACYVIALGLLMHFSMKLNSYIRAQARRRASE